MYVRAILLFFISFLILGCATSSKILDAEGREAFALDCSGSALNWGLCFKKAGEICGKKGYDVSNKSEEQTVFLNSPMIHRTMTIRCKKYEDI